MESLDGRTALIVGGGSGIGLAIGIALAREGCRTVLAARTAANLESAIKHNELGDRLLAKPCDATDRTQVAALVEWTAAQAGPLDILVYSAGINVPNRSCATVDPADFDKVLATNATGAFNCIHAVLPGMRQRKRGLIVNITSLAGLRPLELAGWPYVAAKYAQSAIGSYVNAEALADGVSVTNIYPGEVETPILDKRPVPPTPEHRAMMLQPEDVAAMVVTVAKLPARATVPEIVIVPRHQPLV